MPADHIAYIGILALSLIAIFEAVSNIADYNNKGLHITMLVLAAIAMIFLLWDKSNSISAEKTRIATDSTRYNTIIASQAQTIADLKEGKTQDFKNFLEILKLFDTSKYNQIKTLKGLSNVVGLQNNNIELQNENLRGMSNVLNLQDVSIKEITGGESYAYFTFFPSFIFDEALKKNYRWEMKPDIQLDGVFPLSDVRITIHERKPGDLGRAKPDTFHINFMSPGNLRFFDVNPVPPRFIKSDEDYFFFEINIVQRNDILVQRVVFKKIFEDGNPRRDFWKHAWRLWSARRGGRAIKDHIDPDFPDSVINNWELPRFSPKD